MNLIKRYWKCLRGKHKFYWNDGPMGGNQAYCEYCDAKNPKWEFNTDYLIWSNEHNSWWKWHKRGYTTDIDQAGHYTKEAAVEICNTANHRRWAPGKFRFIQM